MKKLILAALAACAFLPSPAQVKLPSVIADHCVLQRDTDVRLWGKASPGAKVTVKPSWMKKGVDTTAGADSLWLVTVATPGAGGQHSIAFTERAKGRTATVTVNDVLTGEVWLCSGQSNMEMPMSGYERQPLDGANDVIARAKERTPIRMFVADNNDGEWVRQHSKTPREEMYGRWLVNSPENVANTSATAYYFVRYLQDVLEVPVGIVVTSLGGSMIEAWMSRETLEKEFPAIDLSILDDGKPVESQQKTPTVLFNAKINPLTRYGVRGFIWYQGESNRDNADVYADLMEAFVRDLRARFGGGEAMPFYFVEIAPFDYEGADGFSGALLREAQADAAKRIPNSGIATTIDVGHPAFIHPTDKATVGQRLAWLALTDTYGVRGVASHAPQYAGHEIVGNKVYIDVTDAPRGLGPIWTDMQGFEMAGPDGVWHPAKGRMEAKTWRLRVTSPHVQQPVAVRYAFHNYPAISAFSSFNLPLHPFRTDRSIPLAPPTEAK